MNIILDKLKDMMLALYEMLLNKVFENLNNDLLGITDIAKLSPVEWEGGLPWNMMVNIHTNVMIPVAAIILTYVMCMELISLVNDKNNFHDVDIKMVIQIIVKMVFAVVIVNHSLELVAGMYQLGTYLIVESSAIITTSAPAPITGADEIIEQLRSDPAVDAGAISGMIIYMLIYSLIAFAIKIVAYIVVYKRLIEIVLYSSIAPLPMSTMMNKSWSGIGQNYIKGMFALGVQGFLIIFVFAVYNMMLQNHSLDFSTPQAVGKALDMRCILGVVLCTSLLATGNMSKSIMNAH